jgi:hypothetical protein
MILTVRNDFARYRIECPDDAEVKLDHDGTDYLIVPDPYDPLVPYWLFDDILLDAARSNELGLRLISYATLN